MSNENLMAAMEQAMQDASEHHVMMAMGGNPTAMEIWGVNIPAILQMLIEKAKELGTEYRPQLTAAARSAVDALVALDLPWIPESVEGTIDEVTRELGYTAIEAILDALLA